MNNLIRRATVVLVALASAPSWATTTDSCGKPESYSWLTGALAKASGTPVEIRSIKASPALGLCQAILDNGAILYVNALTRSVISGNLYSVTQEGLMIDETRKAIAERNRGLMSTVPEEDTITYPATGERKGYIYVLTDTDCSYCRKLHEDMSQLNNAGLEVRYLPFVRGGEIGTAYETMTGVWCEKDGREALSKALTGTRYEKASCPGADAVNKYQKLGTQLQLRGTPHIIFPNGEGNSGYMPAADLIKIALENQGKQQ